LKESVEAFRLPAGSYNNFEPQPDYGQMNNMQMRPPVRSARPTPLLPQPSAASMSRNSAKIMSSREDLLPPFPRQ